MTKKGIVRRISEQANLPLCQTQLIVQQTIDAIMATLLAESRLELRGFGVFEVKKRAPRRARNPRTGESVLVPEKLKVIFRPSQEMHGRVKSLADATSPTVKSDAPCASSDAA